MALVQAFKDFIGKVKIATRRLVSGLKSGWRFYDSNEVRFMRSLKGVEEEDRPGVYGSAYLKSKVIRLNPRTLKSDDLLWATSALHEAEHAISGVGEDGAIRREFSFLGRVFREGVGLRRKDMAAKAVRAAIIAMRQRKSDTPAQDRADDRTLLQRYGFSERATDLILGA